MKQNLLITVFALAICAASWAGELPWQFEYDKALEEAKAKHLPVLLDFSASWCGPCRMMETTTFADASVQDALKGYLLVKVDFDANAALDGKYNVHAIPNCVLLNQFGETAASNVGYLDARAFKAWLDQNKAAALAQTSKSQMAADRMKTLGAGITSSDPAVRDKAIASLLEIYCARAEDNESESKLAEAELIKFTKQSPVAAARFLDDKRLAVRILFASQLAEKIGAGFSFDPWDGAAARATAAGQWTKQATP